MPGVRLSQLLELTARRRLHPAEPYRSIGLIDLHPIEKQHVEKLFSLKVSVRSGKYLGPFLTTASDKVIFRIVTICRCLDSFSLALGRGLTDSFRHYSYL